MKLDLAEIRLGLYNWVKDELKGRIPSGQIIWRLQSRPLPARPCVTLRLIQGPNRLGTSDNYCPKGDGSDDFVVGGHRSMILSVQVFGDLKIMDPVAFQLASDLNASLSKVTVTDVLRTYGIAVSDPGDVSDISALEETEYEDRAQFDVSLIVAENVEDRPGVIETYEVTPEFKKQP